jgi:signal transduction histidine kinase
LKPLILLSILSTFLLQAAPVYGQTNYIIQHYTNEDGLPANGITGIELDKKNGFLWVATQAGLVRFDGKRFKSLSSAANNVPASRTKVIAKNRDGTIYCQDDNLSLYQITDNKPHFVGTNKFSIHSFVPSATQVVEKFRQDARAAFLPGWVVFHEGSADSNSFSFLVLGQAYHYSANRDTLLHLSAGMNFQVMLKLDGQLYFVRNNLELWTYNDSRMQLVPVLVMGMPGWTEKGERPRFIWQQGMNEPLLVYKKNVWELQRAGDAVLLQPLCIDCFPADAHIITAQVWKEQGLIFLGSMVDGLYVVKRPFLRAIVTDTFKINSVGKSQYAQVEIIPGAVTTSSGHSFSVQGNLLPGKTIREFQDYVIYQNKQGDCWFRVRDTVIHFNPRTGQYTTMGLNQGTFKIAFAETRNRLYVISDTTIAEITGDQYRKIYTRPYNVNNPNIALNPDVAIEWQPGVLAIATDKLVLFDTEKTRLDTVPIPGLITKVRALLKYHNYLFIGTYGQGFYIYKNGVVKKMPLDKNQYLAYAHCFMVDDKGFCWMSTNHGLFKAGMNALVNAYEKGLDEIYYHYFSKDDGLLNTEFNGGCQPCALKLSNGLFSFPNMKGLVVFDPRQQHNAPPAGQLFIDEIVADSISYQINDSSLNALPSNLRNLRFKLALSQFGNSENIYFSYKLDPYNSEWETQDITQNNTLQFGGLQPGDYKLYLRIRNGFEPGDFATSLVEFSILKPWYQSWWVYLLCGLGFIMMTWGLVKWRTARITKRKEELQQQVVVQTKNIAAQSKQLESQLGRLQSQQTKLEEDNKIKARLIAIISHDMLSPLKFMGFMSKRLRDVFSVADPAYGTANTIVTVTQELESLSVNMLNWIGFHYEGNNMKPELFNLYDLINESTEIVSTLANEKGVKLYINVPHTIQVRQYRQAVGVIVYNLTTNAMKNTETGEIRIGSQFSGRYFSLTVSDTGTGMSAELVTLLNNQASFVSDYSAGDIKKSQFGYRIIKDLLQLVHGSMKVESALKKGTQITIDFMLPEDQKMPGDYINTVNH